MVDLSTNIGSLRLDNPIMPGSGTFAEGLDDVVDLDRLGQLLHRLLDVDIGVARVPEDAEIPVDAHVDARGLHERVVERLELDCALVEQAPYRPVGEDHRPAI